MILAELDRRRVWLACIFALVVTVLAPCAPSGASTTSLAAATCSYGGCAGSCIDSPRSDPAVGQADRSSTPRSAVVTAPTPGGGRGRTRREVRDRHKLC